MKNKKLWIFIGMIVLILILNHIFGWSSYLGNTENLKFLENMVQENLVLAIGIYTILTIISCVVLALPGVTFAIVAGLVFGPVLGTICCFRSDYTWGYGSICCRKIFLTGHY